MQPDTAATIALLRDVLEQAAPWLDPKNLDGLAQAFAMMILGVPIVPLILAWEAVGKRLREMSPLFNQWVGRHAQRFSWILNPLIGMWLAGKLWGMPAIGLGAGVAWSVLNSALKSFGKSTPEGLTKLKASVLLGVLGLGFLLGAAPAAAGPMSAAGSRIQPVSAFAMSRWSFSTGGGVRRVFKGDFETRGYLVGQVGYALSDHVLLRVRGIRDVTEESRWEGQGEVVLAW